MNLVNSDCVAKIGFKDLLCDNVLNHSHGKILKTLKNVKNIPTYYYWYAIIYASV